MGGPPFVLLAEAIGGRPGSSTGSRAGQPEARRGLSGLTFSHRRPRVFAMTTSRPRRLLLSLSVLLAVVANVSPAFAADGELRWGLHVTLAPKWLDPAETEAFNTPFMVLYAVHDALVKPMPAGV